MPMWMLRATGDPHRVIKIESDPLTGTDVLRAASTFHFPACKHCNERYGKTLEKRAKRAVEALMAGKSLAVSQCYWLLDWLDKVRVGLWLGYNMLHKEEFAPKFRIDQRIGIKDRVAVVSVDPDDGTKGFGLGGMDNQIFRTSQAGMYLKANNLRILSLSLDGFVSRYAGMPFPKEMLAFGDEPDKLMAIMEKTDYRVRQDWRQFDVPGTTLIAQSSFWLENCADEETLGMYINATTIPRYRRIPRVRKREDLNQFVRTHLISNATGEFRYHTNPRQRIRFGRAKDNTDWHFMRSLYVLFMQEVMPLFPKRVIDPDGTRRGTIQLSMLWLEKAVQMMLRVQQLGCLDDGGFALIVDELQRVCTAWEEFCANRSSDWGQDASANPLTV
ncbi:MULTISPECIES: hypothetical protein [Bradyrhizobium]|uniref:hypothetical protein n=1 Tax=Bradyrhizobium TaxID=374 RepID=UPI00195CE142|nr:hypothetical protein [Bradyrhizobium canariense]MBM7486113.1 hypothetical protein [Bradyrhizobium canariense]